MTLNNCKHNIPIPHLVLAQRNLFYIGFVWIAILVFQMMPLDAWSQNKSGLPKIVHYNRSDFKADPQFWTMCENDDGTLIFGNNDGALIFDGEHWKKVFLPNNSSIRSLVKTKEGKVYAGGYNELRNL